MTVVARLGSLFALAAVALPLAAATSCGSSEFWWEPKQCCLPHGGMPSTPSLPSPPSPPSGSSCASDDWYYHPGQSCCVPKTPSAPTPSCPAGYSWSDYLCKRTSAPSPIIPMPSAPSGSSSCMSSEFWWEPKQCCLPHGGLPSAPSPPSGSSCASNDWYWHPGQSCCVPKTPSVPTPSCPAGFSWLNWLCSRSSTTTPATPSKPSAPSAPTGSSSCSSSEFWWEPKQCCLPHGGQPSPPSPPSGNSCPSNDWYWHTGNSCCVPKMPNPPTPSCPSGWSWLNWLCSPNTPQPSGRHKRAVHKSRTLCPAGLEACPVSGLRGMNASMDYECLDTTSELESCGGCASTGKGQDCTAIEGVWNVGCNKGSCVVYSCAAGYKLGADGQSCNAL
ncbi:hypothetical protein NEOLEDRAFT_4783 [Neolentinus lepideus HHB14362 ss-1]|uniref:Protein CPL1-like domain-containing protein n=1 Tax=Neolentinus lepideus HHB14362 ss-1 TaxID=1314782 RepID=A0A165VYI9_9AGAM|nr:hypothetical protein NEOLEDRAFT_4783 [Neolentinus lepideus HHB14362 ss-1]